jgi:glycosyltransferase involved in cell wall biosynthesis
MAKILHVLQVGYPPEVRAEKIVRSLRQAGHQVYIVARMPRHKSAPSEECLYLAQSPTLLSQCIPYSPVYTGGIMGAIERWKPDLILTREMLITGSAALAARKHHIPVLIDMAEPYPEAMRVWNKYNSNPILRFLTHTARLPDYIEKDAVNKSKGIIVVCDEHKQRLQHLYALPDEHIAIVHNTPEIREFDNVKKGVSEKPSVFGYHGYLTNDRGLDTFIRGFDNAFTSFPHIRLIISGEGSEEQYLRTLAASLPSAHAITFTGVYDAEDLPQLYSDIDFGITPYRVNGFINNTISNKNFDYLLCGKPMLTSLAAPLQRLIHQTGGGIAVNCENPEDIAQGIEQLLSADTHTMAENGMKYANAHYTWQHDSERLVGFIEKYL